MAIRSLYLLVLVTHFCAARASAVCADVNGDGVVDNADILSFVESYLAGSTAADWNRDGLLDNGDVGAFVSDFLNSDCDTPRLQDFRGALRLNAPGGDAIVSSGTVATPGPSNTVIGSIGGSTSGWCALRVRLESDPLNAGPLVVLALGDQSKNQVPEVFGVRVTGDGSAIAAYLRDAATGDWYAIGVLPLDGWTVGAEHWVCWVWDTAGLDVARFQGVDPGDTVAGYVWTEVSGLSAERHAQIPFTAIGRAPESESSPFFWRVGSEVASGPVLDVSEIAVAGELSVGFSELELTEIAAGIRNPCGIEGITHVWALDRRADSTPGGDEVERMDLIGTAHLNAVGSGVTWTPDMAGPTGQSALDPMVSTPVAPVLDGDVDGLRAMISSRNYDVWQFSDSFGVDWIPARFWHAMTSSLDRTQYPVVGWSNGFRISSQRQNSTLAGQIDSSVPYRHVAAVVGPGTYNNGFENGTRSVGFPTDAAIEFVGPLAFPQQQAVLLNVRPLYAGSGSGGMAEWLEDPGTSIAIRTLLHNSAGMSFTLQQGAEAPRVMSGPWAMPRWSDGQHPIADAPRVPDASETLTWLASDHLPVPIAGDTAQVPLLSSDLVAGEYLGIAGWSVHTLNPDESPVNQGIHFSNFSIASQSFSALGTSRAPATLGVKEFADTELLNVVNGVTWEAGRRLLVVMDIADLMPNQASVDLWMLGDGSLPGGGRDEIRSVGFLERVRWAAQEVGYSEIQFLLVSNFMHTYFRETDLFQLRQDHLDTENNLRHIASLEDWVSVLSVFHFLDGAIGLAPDQITRLSSNPSLYASVGWPHREARYLAHLLSERDGILLQQGGGLLDSFGLHTDTSVSGLSDWSQIGNRIWNLYLDVP